MRINREIFRRIVLQEIQESSQENSPLETPRVAVFHVLVSISDISRKLELDVY